MNNPESKSHKRRASLLIIRAFGIGIALGAMVLVASSGWSVRAQTNRFVSTSGNDQGGSNDCSNSASPCRTIQNAINHSGGGDEIDLAPGTYVENVTVNRSVTIRGDAATGSTVDGNSAGSVFLIDSGVSATLDRLTIKNGKAQPSTQVLGGGIYNNGDSLIVSNCTITNNSAPQTVVGTTTFFGDGGGIYNGTNFTLINSTVSHNTAGATGGGIDNHNNATVINCTIAFNIKGGLLNESVQAVLNMTNTLIAHNDQYDYSDFFGTGTLGTNSHNFVQSGGVPSALSGDPQIGPLQDNGGPTFTHALISGSPAIEAGDDSVVSAPLNLTTDQRGAGFPRKGCAHVDIGAYEASIDEPPVISCGQHDVFAVVDPATLTALVSFSATASAGCGGGLPVAFTLNGMTITSPYAFPVGVNHVFATTADSHGRTASCDFFVFVRCVPPTITCPENITVFTDPGKNTASVAFAANASDPCEGALSPLYFIGRHPITSPFDFPVGTSTVKVSVSTSGGSVSCSFTVTVVCVPPTVICPGDISVYTDPGQTTATVSFSATASDPCDGPLTPVYKIGNTVITSPYAFPSGTTTVTASATGSNGLTGSCVFNVTVTLLNVCIQDDRSGDTFRFNSQTGQYLYTRCRDKFTLSGSGTASTSSGLKSLTDNRPDRRISAAFNPSSMTGRANVTLILATGVYQTISVVQTTPFTTCTCP